MKKKPFIILIIVGSALGTIIGVIVITIMVFYPNSFNGAFKTSHEKMMDEKNIEVNHSKRVISVFSEIGHGRRTAQHLKGYWIKLTDPANKNEIDKIFIKRKLAWLPETDPEMIITQDNQIWLIQATTENNVIVLYDENKRTNNFEGFATLIKINDGHLQEQDIKFLEGWTIVGIGKDHATVRNLFNQNGCIDYTTHVIADSICSPN